MVSSLDVSLAGIPCGVVVQTRAGDLKFEYLDSYSREQTPISLSMKDFTIRYPKAKVLPFLQGLLPDNEYALNAIAASCGGNPRNPYSLLQHVGFEVAGALEFQDASQSHAGISDSDKALDQNEIEKLVQSKLFEYENGRLPIRDQGRISLAGAQPKLALHKSVGGEWYLPNRSRLSTHIIKPGPPSFRNLEIIEHQSLLAAGFLGLKVAESSAQMFGATGVFITKRFDRVYKAGTLVRKHQEDFCQALSMLPERKYDLSVKNIAQLFQEIPLSMDRKQVTQDFFSGLVFSVFSASTDAHGKNYSLVLEGENVSLSPLYDLASTLEYPNLAKKSAIKINGKENLDEILETDLLIEAKKLKIDSDFAEHSISKIRNEILLAFENARDVIVKSEIMPNAPQVTSRVLDSLRIYSSK